MIKNSDGTYTYLVVPNEYYDVYVKLLVRMSDIGIDLVKDCSSTCKGNNRNSINCWNMFNAACAAYALGERHKAAFLINYIIKDLKLDCAEIEVQDITNNIYIGISSLEPAEFIRESIGMLIPLATEHNVLGTNNNIFKYDQNNLISYVCIPTGSVELVCAKFGNDIHNTLWDGASKTGAFRKLEDMAYNGINYSTYFYYSPSGIVDSTIYVILKNK